MYRLLFRRIFQSTLGVGVSNAYLKGFVPPGALWQGQSKGFCVPVLNCYACPASLFACPIGTLQHFVIIRAVPFYFLGLFATISMAVGRMACGTLCPFGYLQDILYKIRSFKIRIPQWMTYLKYAALVGLVFIIPFYTLQPWFSKLCPVGTLTGGIPWVTINSEIRMMIRELFWVKIAILLSVVVFSALSKRPFCRTTCPLGAIYSLFNRVSIMRLAWHESACTHCDKCTRICPMDIAIYKDANNHNCIRCFDCTQCPAVTITHAFSKMEIPASEPTFDPVPDLTSG